jgi:hypothetical protein
MNDRHRLAGQAGGPVALEDAGSSIGPVIYWWWRYYGLFLRRARRVSPALWLHNAYPAIELKGDSLRNLADICVSGAVLSSTPSYAKLAQDTPSYAKLRRVTP